MAQGRGASRTNAIALILAIGALGIAGVGLTLARYDVIAKFAGFGAMLGGALLALIALLAGLLGLFLSRGGAAPNRRSALIAVLLALPLVGFIASRPLMAGEVPAIHDITTDLANPPAFQTLPLRADNLAGVETLDNWRRIHGAAYGDLRPVTINRPVAAVMADAHRLAEAQGWRIAAFDAAAGRLEATASVSYIRFYDDVLIVATPTADGQGSIVNMRSVSRIGVSDFGVNARRIRAFLADLQRTEATAG